MKKLYINHQLWKPKIRFVNRVAVGWEINPIKWKNQAYYVKSLCEVLNAPLT